MQNAATILAVLSKRGRQGLPLVRLYRALFNPDLYLVAYGKIYRNAGATTPGSTPETVDGMDLKRIQAIIAALRQERYRWTPVRRTYIEKPHSTKKRPLGIPTWSDKLLQEVLRMLLEAYYEPQFSDHAHGFRPGRGCHTALTEIHHTWRGTAWFIEGDIKGCFDNLDHATLLTILREHIHDERFIRLIAGLLRAGYLQDWRYHRTLSGSPQGGVLSPILANIYLDRLDRYVERDLLPAYNRGVARKKRPDYQRVMRKAYTLKTQGRLHSREAREVSRQVHSQPSRDPCDPDYRRLRYIRYADDFLLGFAGPKAEAEHIKQHIGAFLHDTLKLELSEEKTLVTHARTQQARFLGYHVSTIQDDQQRRGGQRNINGTIGLRIPEDVIEDRCRAYQRRGKPTHRPERMRDSIYSILTRYQSEYRGLVEYYQLAHNLSAFGRLKWVMEQSLAKTLACKLQVSVCVIYRRYLTQVPTPTGSRKVLQVVIRRHDKPPLVARWGGISLARRTKGMPLTLNDAPAPIWSHRTELVERLLADTCELCGSHEHIQVHHIRHMKSLQKPGRAPRPKWVEVMAARHRKTLVVCRPCHRRIHAGELVAGKLRGHTLESRVR